MVSAELSQPQVWCKLSSDIFDVYEVESLRDNTISLEMNVEQLYQVLKQFERSNADQIAIRLQKKETNAGRRAANIGVYFSDTVDVTSRVDHHFEIPVRLLRKESDDRIREPELVKVDVMMRLPEDIHGLFKRVERYKSAGLIKVRGSSLGKLSLHIEDDSNVNLSVSWNELLEVTGRDEDGSQLDDVEHEVTVKMNDWKMGSRICEVCKTMILIISSDEAMVLHCTLDEDETCEIIYFVGAVMQ